MQGAAAAALPRPRSVAPFFVVAAVAAALGLLPLVGLGGSVTGGDPETLWHIVRYVLPRALRDTTLLMCGVALVTGLVGTAAAYLVTMFRFPGRGLLLVLLPLPLAVPTYISAYVYADLLGPFGPAQVMLRGIFGAVADGWLPEVRSLGGAIGLMGFVLYPYVYLGMRVMLQTQTALLVDAARVYGATRWTAFYTVILPLARPALAAGISLALLETLNDIGASEYLGIQTLTRSIFTTWLNRGSLAGAAQLSAGLLVLVLLVVAIERYSRRGRGFSDYADELQPVAAVVLYGWRAAAAAFACFIPVTLGFLLPAGFLLREALVRAGGDGLDPALWRYAGYTAAFALAATAVTLALGFGAAIAARIVRRPFVSLCVAIAPIGYAVPGTVLALGMLSPLALADDAINALARALTGGGVGLVLGGSAVAVVLVYSIRFLAISTELARSGLRRIPVELDDAARCTGAPPSDLVRSIHLPLLGPALWSAAILVFVDCLKELPATLLLRPLNVETLSTYVYQFAARGSFEEGAPAALLIVAGGLLAMLNVVRLAETALSPRHPRTVAALSDPLARLPG